MVDNDGSTAHRVSSESLMNPSRQPLTRSSATGAIIAEGELGSLIKLPPRRQAAANIGTFGSINSAGAFDCHGVGGCSQILGKEHDHTSFWLTEDKDTLLTCRTSLQ